LLRSVPLRKRKVELFETIRREYEHGAGTIRAVAKKLGVHRRMVRQALGTPGSPSLQLGNLGKNRIRLAVLKPLHGKSFRFFSTTDGALVAPEVTGDFLPRMEAGRGSRLRRRYESLDRRPGRPW
jgi:hypothetical protein